MPPRESTSRPPRSNVYSVLLIVSAVFLALAVVITLRELQTDYDFGGQASAYDAVGDEYADDVPADDVADEPVDDEPVE